MDSNELVKQSRARFDHEAARRNLREKYHARLIFAHSGGMFRAGPELLVLLNMYPNQQIVIEDLYQTPISINTQELHAIATARWQEQMNAWLVEHDHLAQQR